MAILRNTPKNLTDAIVNGLDHAPLLSETITRRAFTLSERAEIARDVEPYVRDFVCDKFTASMIENGERAREIVRGLYRAITGDRSHGRMQVIDHGTLPTP